MATISASTDQPTLTGLLLNNVVLAAHSRIAFESDIREMFRLLIPFNQPRDEPNHSLFEASGWNTVFFYTNSPITCNNYSLWLSEDFQSGNRSTSRFKLFTSMDPALTSYTLMDDVPILRPYYTKYGNNAIQVSNAIGPVTAQYFQLMFQALDWGAYTDGPRVNGFQIT